MAEYITKEQVLETECEKCPVYDCILPCPTYNALKNLQPTDVVERSKINKAIEEMELFQANTMLHRGKGNFDLIQNCLEILKRNIGE